MNFGNNMTNKTREKLREEFEKKFHKYNSDEWDDDLFGFIEKAITQSENRILRKWKKAIKTTKIDYHLLDLETMNI